MSCMTHIISFLWKITHKCSRKARYHDAVHDICYFNFVGKISHKKLKKHRYHDAVFFLLRPTSVEVAKTFTNDLRSSATGSQFRLECVSTPPAAASTLPEIVDMQTSLSHRHANWTVKLTMNISIPTQITTPNEPSSTRPSTDALASIFTLNL